LQKNKPETFKSNTSPFTKFFTSTPPISFFGEVVGFGEELDGANLVILFYFLVKKKKNL